MKKYNIKHFDVIADGEALCTKVVQKAIDECSANGGGVVRFGSGRYVLSTVFLRSNVTIEIPIGTEILGAESYYDYEQEEKVDYPIYQDSSHTYYHPSLFVGIDFHVLAIQPDKQRRVKIRMRRILINRIIHPFFLGVIVIAFRS